MAPQSIWAESTQSESHSVVQQYESRPHTQASSARSLAQPREPAVQQADEPPPQPAAPQLPAAATQFESQAVSQQ